MVRSAALETSGHYQYYGRPANYQSIWQFYREVRHIWHKWLSTLLAAHVGELQLPAATVSEPCGQSTGVKLFPAKGVFRQCSFTSSLSPT